MKEMEYTVEGGGPLLPFLLERVRGSRNHVKSLLTRGQVEVDGKTVTRHDHPLTPGQRVAVLAAPRPAAPFPVLYEDGRILVVDKPAGLLSMASDGDPRGRVFIVHRLDRDTSGVLLFARDEDTKRAYQDQWDALVRRRGYLAVVAGKPPRAADTVRTLLRENAAHKVYSVHAGGKEAVTHYRTVQSGSRYTLLEVDIDTGRKNQMPRGGGQNLRRGRRPSGPAVPPRPRAAPHRPLHRGGAGLPGGAAQGLPEPDPAGAVNPPTLYHSGTAAVQHLPEADSSAPPLSPGAARLRQGRCVPSGGAKGARMASSSGSSRRKASSSSSRMDLTMPGRRTAPTGVASPPFRWG